MDNSSDEITVSAKIVPDKSVDDEDISYKEVKEELIDAGLSCY